ncbi:ornithine cyclodeaminase family protein [Candidatus Sumerlaeota bacterium]|nr:ornithine cyclodeaminase family protein [Candidatus Sumerlaeota bacterium]
MHPTLIIPQSLLRKLLNMENALEVVEEAYRFYGEGRAEMPPHLFMHLAEGDMTSRAAWLPDLGFACMKNTTYFSGNHELHPLLATLMLICPETGYPFASMDATYMTRIATGAAGGIASRYLARTDAKVAGFIGAGAQARAQLEALVATCPNIEKALVYDENIEQSEIFISRHVDGSGLDGDAAMSAEAVARGSDILTTLTPSRQPVVKAEWIRPGTHINAIGADAPGKQELEPELLAQARLVVDSWEHAAECGEINVPLNQGLINLENFAADLGEIITGKKPGRENDEQITIFDSSGLAIQDLACAVWAYQRLTNNPKEFKKAPSLQLLD